MWYDLFFLGESLVSTHVQTDFYLEAQKQTDDRKDFDNVTNTLFYMRSPLNTPRVDPSSACEVEASLLPVTKILSSVQFRCFYKLLFPAKVACFLYPL